MSKTWIAIGTIMLAATLSGCAKDASGDDHKVAVTSDTTTADKDVSDETIWIAIVMTWRPVKYLIDKEFSSEVDCWNYYDTGVGESELRSRYGTQVLDHQGNKPDKEYMKKHRPAHREYPTRLYRGITDEQGQVWLTCDIKGRNKGL